MLQVEVLGSGAVERSGDSKQRLPPLQARPRSKLKFWQRDQEKWRACYIELSHRWFPGGLVGLGFLDQRDCLLLPHNRPHDRVCLSGFLLYNLLTKAPAELDASFFFMSSVKNSFVINSRGYILPHTLFLLLCGQKAKEEPGFFFRSSVCSGDCRGVPCAGEHCVNTQLWPAALSSDFTMTLESHLFPFLLVHPLKAVFQPSLSLL